MRKKTTLLKALFCGLSIFALVLSTKEPVMALENPDSELICRCHTAGEGVCLYGHVISFRSRCECLTEGIPGFCLTGGDFPEED